MIKKIEFLLEAINGHVTRVLCVRCRMLFFSSANRLVILKRRQTYEFLIRSILMEGHLPHTWLNNFARLQLRFHALVYAENKAALHVAEQFKPEDKLYTCLHATEQKCNFGCGRCIALIVQRRLRVGGRLTRTGIGQVKYSLCALSVDQQPVLSECYITELYETLRSVNCIFFNILATVVRLSMQTSICHFLIFHFLISLLSHSFVYRGCGAL